jgi:hypothetical protein
MSLGNKDYANANLGDIAEALMCSGIAQAFIKKGQKVTEKEVVSFSKKIVQKGNNKTIINTIIDNNGKTKDEVHCRINIPAEAQKVILNAEKFITKPDLEEILVSIVKYCNTDTRTNADAKKFSSNGVADKIEITADGVGDQKGTKIDIFVKYNGKPTQGNLSLKAGSNRLGNFDRGTPFDYETHIGGLFKELLELPIPNIKREYDKQIKVYEKISEKFTFPKRDREDPKIKPGIEALRKAIDLVNSEAVKEINLAFNKQNYKDKLIKKIVWSATRGDKTLSILDLRRGARYRYGPNFEMLVKKLKFTCKKVASERGGPSKIVIEGDGKPFVLIRPIVQTNINTTTFKVKPRVIWVFETFPLIENLAKVTT